MSVGKPVWCNNLKDRDLNTLSGFIDIYTVLLVLNDHSYPTGQQISQLDYSQQVDG